MLLYQKWYHRIRSNHECVPSCVFATRHIVSVLDCVSVLNTVCTLTPLTVPETLRKASRKAKFITDCVISYQMKLSLSCFHIPKIVIVVHSPCHLVGLVYKTVQRQLILWPPGNSCFYGSLGFITSDISSVKSTFMAHNWITCKHVVCI